MIAFTLTVRPDRSALALGGWSSPRLGGDKATARNADLNPVLPASALRGALRIELERLLAGTGQPACSANALTRSTAGSALPHPTLTPGPSPLEGEGNNTAKTCLPPSSPSMGEEGRGGEGCPCAICRLFGTDGGATGTLRLEDAVLDGDDGEVELLRPTIAVSRRTKTVVEGHLGFAETTDVLADAVFTVRGWLVPRSPDDSLEVLDKDFHLLAAACRALTAIGGGKARGLGWVTCELAAFPNARPAPSSPSVGEEGRGGEGLGEGPGVRALRFRALAPLHFGDGRPVAYFQPTLSFAPGSAVRGALAFALLERGIAKPGDEVFEALFGSTSPVSFGSATPESWIPCATRRRCRPNDHVFDDLVAEIVRRQAARHGVALAVRVACRKCTEATKLLSEPWLGDHRPVRRVRTRTALNRKTGTSMDRKLFSIESLEPTPDHPLILSARVTGLSPHADAALLRLHGEQVWLGGKRSQGLGLCEVTIGEAARLETADVFGLTERVTSAWTEIQSVAPGVEPLLSPSDSLVALVLDEPWRPEEPDWEEALHQGPLPRAEAGKPLARFLEVGEEGRFGAVEAERWGAPELAGESQPILAAAPGSVFVYAVAREILAERLADWLETGNHGSGQNRAVGWGRFHVWNEDEG